jgi:RNA polymerase sigma-70 factor (ECF subfamily)
VGAATEYAALLRPLLPEAGGYARALLRNRDDAEDAVQIAAERGLRSFGAFNRARSFRAWWFTILRNQCLDMRRAASRAPAVPLGDLDPPAPEAEPGFDWARLDDAMRGLSPEHEDILRLKYFGGMSYKDLAQVLGIPAGTVMSRLHAARLALGRALREEEA